MSRPKRSRLAVVAIASVVAVAGCGPSAKEVTLDCQGAAGHGVAWNDTYTIDLARHRFCEADCGRIQSIRGSRVTIDLYKDHVHATVVDLGSGAITAWDRDSARTPPWRVVQGRCERVNKSRYSRYD